MTTFTTLPRPTAEKPDGNCTSDVTFSNGEMHVFDAIPYLEHPAFQDLKAISLYMQARVEHHTVVWNDEIDMAPENLYLESMPLRLPA